MKGAAVSTRQCAWKRFVNSAVDDMRIGDYGLYTCRAGALPRTEQEPAAPLETGWKAEGSPRWRPGPPGSTGSGGIRVVLTREGPC